MTTSERYVVEWARKASQAIAMRDRWIVKLSGEGASLRRIAKLANTTAPTIARILKARRDASAD